ncbi:MAG: hypothetical protein JWP89_2036 [Schlesneria sp.]|nr:hypothetical protein [Schlesneria sp.]
MLFRPFLFVACVLTMGELYAQDAAQPAELRLFDFEDAADESAWKKLELPDSKIKEPPARIERVAENATTGQHSLKITFAGGVWPTVITTRVPEDWTSWHTFHAEVTATRPCVVGFCVMQEASSRAPGWDGGVSRWAKTQFLQPGRNAISASLHPNEWSALRTKLENGRVLGKVVSLEIFLYRPHDGESIFVDNIRVSAMKEATPPAIKIPFKVLGTDLTVTGVQELGKKLADQWTMPESRTSEQLETRFRSQYDELKRKHPRAVLAVLRDGEKGYDRNDPEKVYSGWQDAYWSSHGPDSVTVDRSENFGNSATQEIFMRHRSPLMRVDLSSIPTGSTILAAQLLVVRAGDPAKEHSPLKPNMWAIEACNRPWSETEVDAYRYAGDKYWKAIGGMSWEGDDPDFWPVYVAHGPSQPDCCHWDFVQSVRFWTNGQHSNHGFMLHGDSKDWFRAWFREAPVIKNRPAVLVIYEPK